jgi:hypothetical protein
MGLHRTALVHVSNLMFYVIEESPLLRSEIASGFALAMTKG